MIIFPYVATGFLTLLLKRFREKDVKLISTLVNAHHRNCSRYKVTTGFNQRFHLTAAKAFKF